MEDEGTAYQSLFARHLEVLRMQLAVYRALCELLDERLAALLRVAEGAP